MTSLVWPVKFLLLCTIVQSAPTPKIIDLGYGLDEKTQFWPGTQRYNITLKTTQKNVNGIPWYVLLLSSTFVSKNVKINI